MRISSIVVAPAAILAFVALAASPGSVRAVRFDELVRDDFFAGFAGDRARLDQGMRIAEQALAVNPDHAPALVWHGAGLISNSRAAFQAGDAALALALIERGLAEMDRAVRLAPDDIAVLIPRGATLLRLSEVPAFAARAPGWVDAALANYRHALALKGPRFSERPEHARGELLAGIAEGLDRLGRTAESRDYLRRIVTDVPNSEYSRSARAWLSSAAGGARPRLTCVGCHME